MKPVRPYRPNAITVALATVAPEYGYATLDKLAAHLPDVPRARLARWWQGDPTTIDIATLDLVLILLGCTIDELLLHAPHHPEQRTYTFAALHGLGERLQHTPRRRRGKRA